MFRQLELSLSHNGYDWVADGLTTPFHEKDLLLLEEQISKAIKTDRQFADQESIQVTFRFDMDAIPRWLHQYQSHYFNYSFTVNKQDSY